VKFTALIADDPVPAPAPNGKDAPPNPLGPFGNPLFMILMVGLFFLVVIIPANRRQKRETAAMMAALKPGSKILTSSGILGTVVKLKDGDEEVVIKSEDSKIKILRSTITRVLGEDAETKA
jgi:preprotein translocase subunit YajC